MSQRLFLDMRNRDLLSLVAGLWGAGGAEPTGAQGCHYTPLASLGICSFLPVARTPPTPPSLSCTRPVTMAQQPSNQ